MRFYSIRKAKKLAKKKITIILGARGSGRDNVND